MGKILVDTQPVEVGSICIGRYRHDMVGMLATQILLHLDCSNHDVRSFRGTVILCAATAEDSHESDKDATGYLGDLIGVASEGITDALSCFPCWPYLISASAAFTRSLIETPLNGLGHVFFLPSIKRIGKPAAALSDGVARHEPYP